MSTPQNKSIIKSFKIIEVFQLNNRALTLNKIAAGARTSVSSAHRLVSTMQQIGILRTDASGRYLLGPKLAEIGDQARLVASPQRTLNEIVGELAVSINETVHVGMLRGNMVHYVAKAETPGSLRIATRTGMDLEAYCTGIGKMLLASAETKTIARYLRSGEFVKLTPNTITGKAQLRRELTKICARGYAIDDEEFEKGVKCIAVPILMEGGDKAPASLSISGPAFRIDQYDVEEFVSKLQCFASVISQRVTPDDWSYF